ncbi:hypothetical protein QAD02_009685 [Eretmocerus hayati]|uniref:Uncharacterized protein n=1 Tax=Eretmocerus hayati TaxID=131215 RepID=A0ACC2NCE1_9HYME|nr:hypothetical protein QAD02_009685 [Eretmocerus hayati]
MSETSASRVRKHRFLNRVFGPGEDVHPDFQILEDIPEEELPLQQNSPHGELQINDGLSTESNIESGEHDEVPSDIESGERNENGSDVEFGHHNPLDAQNPRSGDESQSSDAQNSRSGNESDPSDAQNSRSEDESHSSAESVDEDPEIPQIRQWSLDSRIPDKHLSPLLCILRQRLLPQLPKTAKTFLGTTKAVYEIEIMMDSKNCDGEFAYFGIEEWLKAYINVNLHPDFIIHLDFNIDGLKLHKSSPLSMWAHFCKVFSVSDVYKPFPVSVFYGKGKPKRFHDFFRKFIIEMNHLSENGIQIGGQQFSVQIRRFICDTQARDAIKNVQGHTSSCGCGRCKVVGRRVHGVLVFLDLDCEERTSEGFRLFEDVSYHNGPSALLALEPNVDLIYQFILDIMHLIYLGVVDRMLSFLMKGAPNSPVIRLSAQQKTELDRRTLMIRKDIPYEFKRKMQSTNNFEDYHAVDYRFFLLYCCPVVFKKILNNEYYNHWNLLHVATRMLCGPRAVEEANQARDFMHQFVEESIVLYGEVFCTINVHGLSHVADDVERANCRADQLTAFPYENQYGKIKNILLSPHRTVAQYCRKVHLQRSTLQIPGLPEELTIVKRTNRQGITEVKYHQLFFSTKHPNNTALLNNGRVVQIHKFSQIDDDTLVEISYHRIKKSIFTNPIDSATRNCYELLPQVGDPQRVVININQISGKFFKMSLNFAEGGRERIFVILLNHSEAN